MYVSGGCACMIAAYDQRNNEHLRRFEYNEPRTVVRIAVFPASDGPSNNRAVPLVWDFRLASSHTWFYALSSNPGERCNLLTHLTEGGLPDKAKRPTSSAGLETAIRRPQDAEPRAELVLHRWPP